MTATATKTVRELALEVPNATRIFEELGIDYCCGGQKPLEEACASAQVPLGDVLQKLEAAACQPAAAASRDWSQASQTELIEHILGTHHVYTKQELPRLEQLMEKVCSVHGQNHSELREIQQTFLELSAELHSHLQKEEQILFPYLVQTERGEKVESCFGSVQYPIRMMMSEHDNAGVALRQMRSASHNYVPPADACTSYQTLYQGLERP